MEIKDLKNTKGITLIALIVSIIVILIIAGVSITTLTGDNGVITRTITAKQKMEEARDNEEVKLDFLESQMMTSWDGSVASKFPNEDEVKAGEESNPYKITNGAELAYLAKCVNEGNDFAGKYLSIEKSINLGFYEFEPIGKGMIGQHDEKTWNLTQNSFAGTLNGNGHTITGLQITQNAMNGVGLIGVMESSGTIENLNIYEGTIIGRTSVGAFVGASKGTIKNCRNTANVIGQDDENVYNSGEEIGGIVGWISSGNIEGCVNDGSIIGKDESMKVSRGKCVGGIVGVIYTTEDIEDITITIKNCTNNGKITTQYQQAGGILGSTEYSENVFVSIEKCKNTGEVVAKAVRDDLTSTGLNGKVIGISGGIVGWLTCDAEIKGCSNSGKVKETRQQAGGIVGKQESGTISECSNSGEISTLTSNCAGGIVGWMYTGSEKIEKCSNSGKVTAANQKAGGIAGQIESGTVSECVNVGEISTLTSNCAGGIVGCMNTGSEKIEKCSNSGKVTAANQSAGGIVGKQESGTISECSNSGEISTLTSIFAGGIVGWMYTGSEKIEKCSNSGKVTAANQKAGGIAGQIDSGTVSECVNVGEIYCKCNGITAIVGGIIGMVNGANIEVTKVYNEGTVKSENNAADGDRVGGIVGFIKSAKASAITKSYNKGSLIGGDANCVGAIVGRNNASDSVSNCYYYFATETTIPGIGGTTATAEGNYLTGTTRSYTNYATREAFLNGEGK